MVALVEKDSLLSHLTLLTGDMFLNNNLTFLSQRGSLVCPASSRDLGQQVPGPLTLEVRSIAGHPPREAPLQEEDSPSLPSYFPIS